MTVLGLTRVPKTILRTGHLYQVLEDGSVTDLGTATKEDFRLLEFVTQEAAMLFAAHKRGRRATTNTVTRVREFARRLNANAR